MTAAYTLLVLALQLLTLVSTTPSVTPELRAQAISVANTAIAAANAEISAPQTVVGITKPAVQSTPTTQQPVFGATITAPMDQSAVTAEVISTAPADPVNGIPHGIYTIRVRVLDAAGKTVNRASVAMNAPGNAEGAQKTKTIDTRETPESTDYFTSFSYVPMQTGTNTLVFTSGALSTSLSVSVQ